MTKSVSSSNGRRTERRIPIRLPIIVTIKDPRTGSLTSHPGHTLNISSMGITFVIHQPVSLSSTADIQILPSAPFKPVSVRGWLTWEDEKNGVYGVYLSEANVSLKEIAESLNKKEPHIYSLSDRRKGERRQISPRQKVERRGQQDRRSVRSKRTSKTEFNMFDRRSTIRVQTDLPVQIEVPGGETAAGMLESFSEHGICFRMPAQLLNGKSCSINIPLNGGLAQVFSVEITWSFPFEDGHRYGARFFKPSSKDLQTIREYLAKMLKKPASVSDRRLKSTIVSELVSYTNRQGMTIVGYHDHRASSPYREDPLIIIPSAYAETKKDALQTSYYLVANGFQVLRYDNTNHTGESEGDILNITLNQFKEDIFSTVDYAERMLKASKIGIVAISLSARTAIKAAAEDKRISFLLGLVTAIDVRYTLNAVYCEDLVGTYKKGKLWGVTNVLGCNTYLDAFLKDTIDQKYEDVKTTLADVARIHIPFILLAAEHDPWVQFEDVARVIDACPSKNKEIHLIPAMHQLKESPKAAQAAFRLIVSSAIKYFLNGDCRPLSVIEPSLRWLAVQNRIERQRMHLFSSFEKKAQRAFWTQYLDQFHFINELPDYRQLLQAQYENLHGVHPDEKILDAGCGNGTFGLWLLAAIALQAKSDLSVLSSTFARPVEFHCLDYVQEAIAVAKKSHLTLQDQLFHEQKPIAFQYHVADLDGLLPFGNKTFDKVSANLVISYLRDPVMTLREFIRVTKKGGRIVVSTLKPYADTSQIYRNYIQSAPGGDGVEKTRKLLNNAGDIRLRETEGSFTFFSEEELTKMAQEAGANESHVIRAFGNQANVLIMQG